MACGHYYVVTMSCEGGYEEMYCGNVLGKLNMFFFLENMVKDPHDAAAAWEENRLAYERQHYCKNERSAESLRSGWSDL